MAKKKATLTLPGLYPVAQYLGAGVALMVYPFLPGRVLLLTGLEGSRRWVLLWAALLLSASVACDRAYLRAWKKDLWEQKNKCPGGNLNRGTFLALAVPMLLAADAAALVYLYGVYLRSPGGLPMGWPPPLGAVSMSVGAVLWIYGRRLPWLKQNSLWGVRTSYTLSGQQAWTRCHGRAARPVACLGGGALLCGAFLPSGLGCALACAMAAAAVGILLRLGSGKTPESDA